MVGAGKAEGAIDAGNMLKPALARGELHCVGATTLDEYRKYIEKMPRWNVAFKRCWWTNHRWNHHRNFARFAGTLRTASRRGHYRSGHHCRSRASHRYITDRFFADKAIDLIDESRRTRQNGN